MPRSRLRPCDSCASQSISSMRLLPSKARSPAYSSQLLAEELCDVALPLLDRFFGAIRARRSSYIRRRSSMQRPKEHGCKVQTHAL